MLLNHKDILELIRTKRIENSAAEFVNGTSLDITLGPTILVEPLRIGQPKKTVVLGSGALDTTAVNIAADPQGYHLQPGEFILAHSVQIFNLPDDISAEYKLKSSLARIGLEHLNAGWCDPGWNGSCLTLELKNMTRNHNIFIQAGVRIGQVVFFRHERVAKAYSYSTRGRYNGDAGVRGAKGEKA